MACVEPHGLEIGGRTKVLRDGNCEIFGFAVERMMSRPEGKPKKNKVVEGSG
jgi:hypothetical protein